MLSPVILKYITKSLITFQEEMETIFIASFKLNN